MSDAWCVIPYPASGAACLLACSRSESMGVLRTFYLLVGKKTGQAKEYQSGAAPALSSMDTYDVCHAKQHEETHMRQRMLHVVATRILTHTTMPLTLPCLTL